MNYIKKLMNKPKYILIGEKQNTGQEEWWCHWYRCTNCKKEFIASFFKYCPNCGVKLRWRKLEI